MGGGICGVGWFRYSGGSMAAIREIKGRIKATANIKRITKTMQMIATAKFQGAQRTALAAKPYAENIASLVEELAAAVGQGDDDGDGESGGVMHPLLRKPDTVKKELLLVITSNRGLCGGYNANVLREASAFLTARPVEQVELEVAGKKGAGFFKFTRRAVSQFHSDLNEKPDYAQTEKIAQAMIDRFVAGEVDAVRVAYMKFETLSRQVPEVVTLLPLEDASPSNDADAGAENATGKASESGTQAVYEYSPDPKSLMAALLPITVKTRLHQCFNEANLGENLARMIAMKAATDAADKMRKGLTRKYNRARQAAITTELSEIISGAAALE